MFLNNIYSHDSIYDILNYINSNNLLSGFESSFKNNESIVYGNDLSILYEEGQKNNLNKNTENSSFRIYKNSESKEILKINDTYIANIYNYGIYKLVLFSSGNFILSEKTNKISLFIETTLDYDIKEKKYTIKGVKNIFGIDNKINPINVTSFYNNQVLFTSYFRYDNDFVEEKIIFVNPDKSKKCNFLKISLKMTFFKLQVNNGGSICSFSRVTYNRTKINRDNLFWFLRYFIDVNHYSDDIFKYEE